MLNEGLTFWAIGEKFGVSDNAVRKWCRGYGLPATNEEREFIVAPCGIHMYRRKVRKCKVCALVQKDIKDGRFRTEKRW